MGNIGNIWVSLGLKMDEFDKGLSTAQKAMVKVGDRFQGIGKSLSIAGAAITASMGAIIIKTTALGDTFDDLRQRTGISTETLSSFSLAVNKTDMGITGFATALKFLANNMADASAKGGEAKAKFDTLGVSFRNLDGTLRPLDQVMLDVADRFAAMPDGAEKSALAVDLFGRAGTGMIHMLNLGRDGLQAEIDKAKEFGIVFTTDAAGASDKFQESLVDLRGALQGVGMTITAAVLPMVQGVITGITGVISKVREWAAEHPGLTKAITGTVLGIGGLFTALGTLSFAIGTVLKQLPTFIKGLNVIKAIALNPIVITIAIAIPVLAKALSDFKKEFDNMQDSMKEAGSSGFIAFLEGVNSGWRKVALGIKDSNIVMSEANNKIISVKGAISLLGEAFRAIKGAIDAGATSVAKIANVFKEFGLKTKTELTEELGKAEAALKLLKSSAEATPGAITALEDKIKTLRDSLYGVRTETETLTETFTPMARGASFVRDVMQGFAGELTTTFIPAARDMSLVLAAAPGVFDETGSAAGRLEFVFKAIGDAIGVSAATVAVAMWNIQATVLAAMGIIIPKIQSLAPATQATTQTIAGYFDGLFNDIATGFGNTIQKWLEGATTFKNFMEDLWGNIKTSFFRMIGEMIAEWLVNFVKNLIGGAVSAATGVAGAMTSIGTTIASLVSTVGTVLTTLVTSIGTAIVTLATAIGTAMVTLATGIASAATIIAAAAPAIIVTSLLAAGIMAGLNLLKRIFAAGSSGAGDGMGRVVERQDIQISLITRILETLEGNLKPTLWGISTKLSILKDKLVILNTSVSVGDGYLKTSSNYLKTAAGYLKTIAATIGNLTGAVTATATATPTVTGGGSGSDSAHFASGGIAYTPQLARIAERGPEIIMPLREYRNDAVPSAGGRNGPVVVNIRPVVIDKKDRYLIEFIQENFDHHVFRVPTAVVGG